MFLNFVTPSSFWGACFWDIVSNSGVKNWRQFVSNGKSEYTSVNHICSTFGGIFGTWLANLYHTCACVSLCSRPPISHDFSKRMMLEYRKWLVLGLLNWFLFHLLWEAVRLLPQVPTAKIKFYLILRMLWVYPPPSAKQIWNSDFFLNPHSLNYNLLVCFIGIQNKSRYTGNAKLILPYISPKYCDILLCSVWKQLWNSDFFFKCTPVNCSLFVCSMGSQNKSGCCGNYKLTLPDAKINLYSSPKILWS